MAVPTVYLAARYSRHPEMRQIRDQLYGLGFKVTSRWIDMHGGKYPSSFTPEILNSDPAYCGTVGQHDVEDVQAADVVISFTEGGGGKGGRHVEFGIALALGKELFVIGPREHIFHTLPQVRWYGAWEECVPDLLRDRQMEYCPNSKDGAGHCRHWWDNETSCCWCGDDTNADLTARVVA